MSPEAQRIAIAEACGWRRIERKEIPGSLWPDCVNVSTNEHGLMMPPIGRVGGIPQNYLADLNAMHEAEKTLDSDGIRWLANNLREMLGNDGAISATAAQRAEAFLRTIGKWDDSK